MKFWNPFTVQEIKRRQYTFEKRELEKKFSSAIRKVRKAGLVDFPCNRAWRECIEIYHASTYVSPRRKVDHETKKVKV